MSKDFVYHYENTCKRVEEIEAFIMGEIKRHQMATFNLDPKDRLHFSAIKRIAAGNIAINLIVHEQAAVKLSLPVKIKYSVELAKILDMEAYYKSLISRDDSHVLH